MAAPDTDPATDLAARLAFLGLTAEDQARLRQLAPQVDASMVTALAGFYRKVAATEELRRQFRDQAHMAAAESHQRAHWQQIMAAEFGPNYAQAVRRIGAVHARIGLAPRWYVGGYGLVLDRLIRDLASSRRTFRARDRAALGADLSALIRAALLDIEMSISTYLDEIDTRRLEAEAARQSAFDELAAAMARLSAGDLSARVCASLSEQTGFNRTIAALAETIGTVGRTAAEIGNGMQEIAAASNDLARRTEQQAASLEQTSAALTEMTGAVQEAAQRSREADTIATRARSAALRGSQIMDETRSAMTSVSGSASEMGQIIGVINEIAFQTNLLALNAGVEAARAGDAGRGFAVVAAEVRGLAQRSAEAVRMIQTLIDSSIEQTQRGASLVGDSHSALNEIVSAVEEMGSCLGDLSAGAQRQATGIAQINAAMIHLDDVTQQNAAMVEEASATSSLLNAEAQLLTRLVSEFSGLPDDPARPQPQPQPGPLRHAG